MNVRYYFASVLLLFPATGSLYQFASYVHKTANKQLYPQHNKHIMAFPMLGELDYSRRRSPKNLVGAFLTGYSHMTPNQQYQSKHLCKSMEGEHKPAKSCTE